jgi:hypothetical protein
MTSLLHKVAEHIFKQNLNDSNHLAIFSFTLNLQHMCSRKAVTPPLKKEPTEKAK